ncbi:LysR family transcriptional regulator [Actinocatenispora thailandica]|uniref:LysR family transcriptional regulator n=1 Tax=Actinocatenispora thailandica TaxID=227318 RepID=A0A7R7HY23_9ACTN|nr:LysR family transcriptional regulator [Actinocatenispora thailandica]BCJ35764.1 LysR family transcriptional regulator [Actinocatenispora thailandica]
MTGMLERLPSLRDVRCFVTVSELRSFSAAARSLGLSQPAISQAVGRFERALGCRLLERSSRSVRLSAAGEALLAPARSLLTEAGALLAAADRWSAAPGPTITLAYPPMLGTFAARIARRLTRRQPGAEVLLRSAGQREAAELAATGTVTAAILAAPVPLHLTAIPLFTVMIDRLAVPTGDPLAQRRSLGPAALTGRRVLVPAHRPAGGPWPALVAALPPRSPYPAADDLEDPSAALDLVAARIALLPLPSLVADTVRRPDVRFVPLAEPPPPLRFRLAWAADAQDPAVLILAQAVQRLLQTR